MNKPSFLNRLISRIIPQINHNDCTISYTEIPDDDYFYVGRSRDGGYYVDDDAGGHILSPVICKHVRQYKTRQQVINDWGMIPIRVKKSDIVNC